MKNRTNQILLAVFLLTLAIYVVIFAACFSELPITPSPPHQLLVLYFHFIPMFLVQLLLCRLSTPWWWKLVPFLPMVAVGLVFLYTAEWYILGWILVLWWFSAPAVGCVLAWAAYRVSKSRERGETHG